MECDEADEEQQIHIAMTSTPAGPDPSSDHGNDNGNGDDDSVVRSENMGRGSVGVSQSSLLLSSQNPVVPEVDVDLLARASQQLELRSQQQQQQPDEDSNRLLSALTQGDREVLDVLKWMQSSQVRAVGGGRLECVHSPVSCIFHLANF